MSESTPGDCGDVCMTMQIGAAKLGGSFPTRLRSVSMPPADVPMTTSLFACMVACLPAAAYPAGILILRFDANGLDDLL
jgi:hypothetical protein